MAIAGSPGWSESGGPWVTPAQAMKKYVWSETRLEGGRPFTRRAAQAAVDDRPLSEYRRGRTGSGRGRPGPEFYADSAVVAFRCPDNDKSMAELEPKVTSSGGAFDLAP